MAESKTTKKAAPTLESVTIKAKDLSDRHILSSAWIRDKISSKIDSLTPESLAALDAELDQKAKEYAEKNKPAAKK